MLTQLKIEHRKADLRRVRWSGNFYANLDHHLCTRKRKARLWKVLFCLRLNKRAKGGARVAPPTTTYFVTL
ncbi:hypothetical protein T07_5817 [Trichinella nelsoni]|uniref:Uncharacterized protein n=1 Tax=Trichinella nelsoni TaxID=6336 RepID=A0A0V0SKQ0_9BILA|nr:hypothetical protein T07_5817 [Trichinella nelsoni]